MSKLNWEKFKEKFDESWHLKMKPFIESKECYDIYQVLKSRGNEILPYSKALWKAFRWCNLDNLKCIVVGQSPYHTLDNGIPLADGIAFSCSNTKKESPSLKILFDAIAYDLDRRTIERNPNLDYLCFQDILMLNLSLTIKRGDKNSFGEHELLWRPFIEYLFKEVLNTMTGIPIILFGSPAKEQIVPLLHDSQPYKCVKHPAWYARDKSPMFTDCFSWASKMSFDNNGEEIYWDYNDYLDKGLPF